MLCPCLGDSYKGSMRVHGSSDGSFLEDVYRRAFQAFWAIAF